MNFDRLAPYYDWMETLTAGGRLQQARTTLLGELRGRQRILSVGEGHGRFAEAAVESFPDSEFTFVEASPQMLARGQIRVGHDLERVRWHCGDVLTWEPDSPFDAIVTCFFLDCFPPDTLSTVMERLARCATPDAVWLVVDFALPQSGPALWRAQAVHSLMYAFFRRVVALPAWRLTPPDALLRAHGFKSVQHREFEWGLLRAELWRRV